MSNKEQLEVAFNELTISKIHEANNKILKVIKDSIDFYLIVKLKEDSNKAVVFSNGTYNPEKNSPPIFMRENWSEDYDTNCLYIDDRTLHDYRKLRVAYGIGTPAKYYLAEMSEIIKKILYLMNVDDKSVIYFGSSSGGYMSIAYSIFHKDSKAIVNNPRLFIDYASTSKEIYQTIFPSLTKEEIQEKYGYRLSIVKLMSKESYIPNITVLMNQQSTSDFEVNYKKFITECKNKNMDLSTFNIMFYQNYDKGHDILSREKTAAIINGALNNFLPTLP